MPTRTVDLPDQLDQYVQSGVETGRFPNASEAIREGLELLIDNESDDQAKLKWLQDAVKEACDELDRGEGIHFDSVDELAAYIDHIGAEASAELAAQRRTLA